MNNPTERLGIVVKKARKKKKLSQRELAARLGMNVRTIIDIEKFRSNPKFETVAILANELDIDLGDVAEMKKNGDGISTAVRQFFSGMSDEDAERYVAMCVYIDGLYAPKIIEVQDRIGAK